MGGRAHRWTRAPSGRADGQADGRKGGRADGRTMGGWADKQTEAGGRVDRRTGGQADRGRGAHGRADRRMGQRTGGRVGGLANWRTGGRGRTGRRRTSEGKTPDIDASIDMAVGNPMWPSLGNCKVTPFTSSVTVMTGSDTMSCRHHADFVVKL